MGLAALACSAAVYWDCRFLRMPLWVHGVGAVAVALNPRRCLPTGAACALLYLGLWGFSRWRWRVAGVGLGDALLAGWLATYLPWWPGIMAAFWAFPFSLLLRFVRAGLPSRKNKRWRIAPLAPAMVVSFAGSAWLWRCGWLGVFLLVAPAFLQAQNTFTKAQRARSPEEAAALIDGGLCLPGNTILTLVAHVYLWPRKNVTQLGKASSIKLPKPYVLMLASKYGCMGKEGKRETEPFGLKDLLDWARHWETPDEEMLTAWLQRGPRGDLPEKDFLAAWRELGGKPLSTQILSQMPFRKGEAK